MRLRSLRAGTLVALIIQEDAGLNPRGTYCNSCDDVRGVDNAGDEKLGG